MAPESCPPRFVVFEGVDGTGKTAFSGKLARYYRERLPEARLWMGAFPGSARGTIGELIYRLHHGQMEGGPKPSDIAPVALQMLHVAAHVDGIEREIRPAFSSGSSVILDRYWWSTYAYVRQIVSSEVAWRLVGAELPFWEGLPEPTIIYLERHDTLKPGEVTTAVHTALRGYYQELVNGDKSFGGQVIVVANDGSMEDTWRTIANHLNL